MTYNKEVLARGQGRLESPTGTSGFRIWVFFRDAELSDAVASCSPQWSIS